MSGESKRIPDFARALGSVPSGLFIATAGTGVAPACNTALAVATKVRLGTRTSSPGCTPTTSCARWSPAVPLDNATAWLRPHQRAISDSNAPRSGPTGAIQLESKASSNRARSTSVMCGGDR